MTMRVSDSLIRRPGRGSGSRVYGGYLKGKVPPPDMELAAVGRRTPMGEYMRRYWHPVCLSEELTEVPHAIRILGDELVAFRDREGRVGVVDRHCSHRGTSLEYGIIQPRGIRCCYHGWLIDIDGTILETPGEPPDSKIKDTVFHGAYPAFERSGLVFAYLGHPDERPAIPEFDCFTIPEDNDLVAFSHSYPCNWLQLYENNPDHMHTAFLHNGMTVKSVGKAVASGLTVTGFEYLPILDWVETNDGNGMVYIASRRTDGEHVWVRSSEMVFPNITHHGSLLETGSKFTHTTVSLTRWHVPVDDQNSFLYGWRHFNSEIDPEGLGDPSACGKESVDFMEGQSGGRSYAESQRAPGDWEAVSNQRRIAVHAMENPGTTDVGVYMMRRMLSDAVRRDAKPGGRNTTPGNGTPGIGRATEGEKLSTHGYGAVVRAPMKPGRDDREFVKGVGRTVFDVILARDRQPSAQRTSWVREQLSRMSL